MDEMEMNINLKAIKWSWFSTNIVLFGWIIYDKIQGKTISMAFSLVFLQMMTLVTSYYY